MLYKIVLCFYNGGEDGDTAMLGDNIQQYRKARGLTQEQLAAQIPVVRQTLSKWEKNLSAPDAQALLRLSQVLGVSVETLLDNPQKGENLSAELARVNEELAERNRRLEKTALAGRQRGKILFLSFLALGVALAVESLVVSAVSVGVCILLALGILYRNLPLLCQGQISPAQNRLLKLVTIFDGGLFAGLMLLSVLVGTGRVVLSQTQEKWLLVGLFSCLFLFFGAVSPRLPFQRHTGLRLPWTVLDEPTWNLAHRILGMMALPITVLYVAVSLACPDIDTTVRVSVGALLLYIAIPGLLSLLFYLKQYGSLRK